MAKSKEEIDKILAKRPRITKETFDSKNCKIKITMMLDLDLYDELNAEAKRNSGKYQTLINRILRDYVESEASDFEAKVRKVLKKIEKEKSKKSA